MPHFRLHITLLFLAMSASPLHAQEAGLKDVYGDPLPPGAIGRLGSARWRVGGPATAIRFLENGKKLLVKVNDITSSVNNEFQVFDAQTGQELRHFAAEHYEPGNYSASIPGGWSPQWCCSPDGRLLGKLSWGKANEQDVLEVQDVATGKVILLVEEESSFFGSPQFSADGKSIGLLVVRIQGRPKGFDPRKFVVSDNSTVQTETEIRVLDVSGRKEVRAFKMPPQFKDAFWPAFFALSPDGAHIAVPGSGKSGGVLVWDTSGKKPPWQLEGKWDENDEVKKEFRPKPEGNVLPVPEMPELEQSSNETTLYAFSPSGKALAAVCAGRVGLWDVSTGKQIKEVAVCPPQCAILDFSPDGKHLLVCNPNRRATGEKALAHVEPGYRQ